jgi:hypothetical protein
MRENKLKIAIIGSGLSAYASIMAALDLNATVTVLDIGEVLPPEISRKVLKIRDKASSDVHISVAELSRKTTEIQLINRAMPKKTLFGSQYFYREEQLMESHKLPFSQALGGYSVAWGGAFLPPAKSDLPTDTINYEDLKFSMRKLAKNLSLPFFEDSLTQHFPNYSGICEEKNLKLSRSQKILLERLTSIQSFATENTLIVGQSRLMTRTSGVSSCRYCGMCSHGCVFDSIFSAETEIKKLIETGRIQYLSSCKVIQVVEFNSQARIEYVNLENGLSEMFEADCVFVAAGAVNSTKIAIKSFGLEDEIVHFQKTGGFVRPYFSLRKIGFDWPLQNTQSNIFMEIMDFKLSKFWIHSQVSTPNEIVVLGLGHLSSMRLARLLSLLRKFLLARLVIVMTNLHSSEGPIYELKTKSEGNQIQFHGDLKISQSYLKMEKAVELKIKRKLRQIGLFAIPFTRKGISNGPGYHVGGSMPIGGKGKLSTDALGRFSQSSKISFVDTSVLPCIPATTIGFLTMANAHRITTQVLKTQQTE